MALFGVRSRWAPGSGCADSVPASFEAVAEMLAEGRVEPEMLRDAGRAGADAGTALERVLDDLVTTCRLAAGLDEPPFPLVRAVAAGWSDAQMGYLHSLSCEDPLTGLTSIQHVRTRLADAYRAAAREGDDPDLALVVVDVLGQASPLSRLNRTMRLVHVSEMLRVAFSGDETLGRLSGTRAVAVVRRDGQLPTTVRGLRELLTGWSGRGGPATRVWIEGLPTSAGAAVALLDELAR